MTAYYNEIDPYAAQWLRNLIAAGHIAPGDVDERSIKDVQADDLKGYDQCHFFAGIGGWSYALRLSGWPDDRPVWTGSCPCQPFSAIGKGKGEQDERHLWPVLFSLIRERNPDVIFGEQVASQDGLGWLDGVWSDMEAAGYSFAAADLCAASVGAPHIRQRLYWVGDSKRKGLERHNRDGSTIGGQETARPNAEAGSGCNKSASMDAVPMLQRVDLHDSRSSCSRLRVPAYRGMEQRPVFSWQQFDALPCSDGWRRVQSGTFPLANGIPARLGRLRSYGNAIVPQVAQAFIESYLSI